MQALINLFMAHQVLGTVVAAAVWNSFVGALDAPTKTSSPYYVFVFKFSNALAFNFQRARSTSIENSPNFEEAVKRYLAQQGNAAQPIASSIDAPHL